MARVLCNVMKGNWSVHFIGPDGKTQVGPWLLLNSHDEVRAILRWGNITAEELAEHESSIKKWGVSSAVLNLTTSNWQRSLSEVAAAMERLRTAPDEKGREVSAQTAECCCGFFSDPVDPEWFRVPKTLIAPEATADPQLC